MKRKTLSVAALAAITGIAVAAAVLTQQSGNAIPKSGEPLVPGLLERVNDAAVIVGTSGGETVEIRKADGEWRVPARHGYYAAADKVHQLVVGAAGLERIEPKTARPELYPKIGLDDPTAEGSEAIRYTVRDAGGETLLDVVVGNREPAKGDPRLWEYYVRFPDEARSWLVQGKIPLIRGLDQWTATDLLDIERARVHRARVEHPDGEVVEVVKADASDADFELVGKPDGAEVAATYHVNDIGRGMADLDLEDVLPAADRPADLEPGYRVEMQTFDGLVVEMRTERAEDAVYATVSARFDPQAVDRSAEVDPPVLEPEDAVKAAVERYNRRWSGWVFRLPSYRANYFAKKSADLLEDA